MHCSTFSAFCPPRLLEMERIWRGQCWSCRKMPEVNDVERGTWLRALRILETLVSSPEPLVLERVAELAALPKATAHRFLQELTAAGFLLREPRPKTYGVGPRLAALGLDSVVNGAWRVERRAILERLVSE